MELTDLNQNLRSDQAECLLQACDAAAKHYDDCRQTLQDIIRSAPASLKAHEDSRALEMALLIAALSAQGTSTIYNVRQIDRGYERVDEKLRSLGASIERATT